VAAVSDSVTHRAIDAVWRIESARLIAGLARIVRDVGVAEDLAQDALVAALEQWPQSGVPDKPGAWLMAIAKRRAIDLFRRNSRLRSKQEQLGREQEVQREIAERDIEAAIRQYGEGQTTAGGDADGAHALGQPAGQYAWLNARDLVEAPHALEHLRAAIGTAE